MNQNYGLAFNLGIEIIRYASLLERKHYDSAKIIQNHIKIIAKKLNIEESDNITMLNNLEKHADDGRIWDKARDLSIVIAKDLNVLHDNNVGLLCELSANLTVFAVVLKSGANKKALEIISRDTYDSVLKSSRLIPGDKYNILEESSKKAMLEIEPQSERALEISGKVEKILYNDLPDYFGNVSFSSTATSPIPDKVFIVHGHDSSIKFEVARFVENELGIKSIILHERPNEGQTLIEKFEKAASEAMHAIILLTGDDIGSIKNYNDIKDLRPRARQNVILELGYFLAKLGRSRTIILVDKGVEMPSDVSGLIYINIDSNRGWKYELQKEIKNSNLISK